MPQVSVVVPLYNKAPYVEATLRSVQAQSLADLEIVVVDDGSTDGGATLVEKLDEPRIRLIRQANAGAAAARNAGIAAARGRWIAFLDADDLWLPDKLAQQLHLLEAHPDVAWASGAHIRVIAGRHAKSSQGIPRTHFAAEGVIEDALASVGGAIWTSTVMVRRDVLHDMGGFDPALRLGEDTDLWVRLAVGSPRLAYVERPIAVRWEQLPGSLTALAHAEGASPAAEHARRWAEMAKALPRDRSELLRMRARRLVEGIARWHFVTGRSDIARETLGSLVVLDLGAPSWPLRMAARVPGPTLRPLLAARRRCRQWLFHWCKR
jgi:hypothetical protein